MQRQWGIRRCTMWSWQLACGGANCWGPQSGGGHRFRTRNLWVKRQIARISGKVVEAPAKRKRLPDAAAGGGHDPGSETAERKNRQQPLGVPPPTTAHLSPDSVLICSHRVLKRAGLPKVRFHDLRHTFAWPFRTGWTSRRCPGCWGHFSAGFTWTPTPMSRHGSPEGGGRTMEKVLAAL